MRNVRSVHFPIIPVTGLSRRPTAEELDALWDLEDHVHFCRQCRGAFHFGHFHRLCTHGFDCADRVVYLMYGAWGKAYSTMFPTTRFMRIEVSLHFRAASRLLNLHDGPQTSRVRRRGQQNIH